MEKRKVKTNDRALSAKVLSDYPKAICSAELKLGDESIPCAVLDGEIRVLSQRRLLSTLERYKQSGGEKMGDGKLPIILRPENLQPYINEDVLIAVKVITYNNNGQIAYGINAEALPMICSVYLRAQKDQKLTDGQNKTADKCFVLQEAFAKTGIIALIDEATRYQDIRPEYALTKILEKYLAKEARKWISTFPLDFYREIYRLRNWEWKELENGKKPPTPDVIGKYTDNFIYKRIAPGILTELRNKNPDKRSRHHQWFNAEHGHPKLREHIASVVAVMKLSENWEDAKRNINKVFPLHWPEGTLFFKDK